MVTIMAKPQDFTPVENPVIWQIQSSLSNIVYFRVNVYVSTDITMAPDQLLSALDCYTTPAKPLQAYVNLSMLLRNVTRNIFRKGSISNSSYYGMTYNYENLVRYKLEITERALISGVITDVATYETNGNQYVFSGGLDSVTMKSFNYNLYQVSPTSAIVAKFLTSRKNTKHIPVNQYSRDVLYFLQDDFIDGATQVVMKVEYYNTDGTTGTITQTYTDYDSYLKRINISKVDVHPLAFFTPEQIDNLSHYNVYLYDTVNNRELTERRYYKHVPITCIQVPVSVFWLNKFGVYEHYQFVMKESSTAVTSTSIKRNTYQYDNTGNLTNYEDYRFNQASEIINNNLETTWKLYTNDLSDDVNVWLSSILMSKSIYIMLTDDLYIPATVVNTSQQLTRKRAISGANIKDYSFKLMDGFSDDYEVLETITQDLIIEGVDSYFYQY